MEKLPQKNYLELKADLGSQGRIGGQYSNIFQEDNGYNKDSELAHRLLAE